MKYYRNPGDRTTRALPSSSGGPQPLARELRGLSCAAGWTIQADKRVLAGSLVELHECLQLDPEQILFIATPVRDGRGGFDECGRLAVVRGRVSALPFPSAFGFGPQAKLGIEVSVGISMSCCSRTSTRAPGKWGTPRHSLRRWIWGVFWRGSFFFQSILEGRCFRLKCISPVQRRWVTGRFDCLRKV
jgi:hypothetical protein